MFYSHLLLHKSECLYRHASGLTQSDFITNTCVYLYFSARARAKAPRNLSIDTWASGVKSLGNLAARTTRMLWDRIYEKQRKQISWAWLYECERESELTKDEFVALTLKFAGSTRSVKAWSSLRFRSPAVRSSILLTASATPPITVCPCFLTGAEPGLRSFQWEK